MVESEIGVYSRFVRRILGKASMRPRGLRGDSCGQLITGDLGAPCALAEATLKDLLPEPRPRPSHT